jgi:hypothetical protein
MSRSDGIPEGEGRSEGDVMSATEPLPGAPMVALARLDDAFAPAREGDMETVDIILRDVLDMMRRSAPLPPAAWDEVRQVHARLQQVIDQSAEQIRAQLGAAGGGRMAARRYGAAIPVGMVDE